MRYKFLLTLLFAVMSTSTFAQLSGDGFYRVKNHATGRYISVVGNSLVRKTVDGITTFLSIEMHSDNVQSDPSTILYLKADGNDKYIIEAQGINSKEITGYDLTIKQNEDGTYSASGQDGTSQVYLGDMNVDKWIKAGDGSNRKSTNKWEIIPVGDNEILTLHPEVSANGKFYTFYYVGFAFNFTDDVRAFYVSELSETAVGLSEISTSLVPAKTPVLLECKSQTECVITPVASSAKPIPGNYLEGVFFNRKKDATISGDKGNTTRYIDEVMRVLGLVDGKLSFVQGEEGSNIAANSCFVYFEDDEPMPSYPVVIPTSSSISELSLSNQYSDCTFNALGQRVQPSSKGLVIYKGKKYVNR